MSEEDIDEFVEKVKTLAMEIRAGVCPIWQCGGELEYLEDRTNWQEPDLRCKDCGAFFKFTGYEKRKVEGKDNQLVKTKKNRIWKQEFQIDWFTAQFIRETFSRLKKESGVSFVSFRKLEEEWDL